MEKLWKATMTIGIALGVVCFAVLMIYSLTKSVIITEEQDWEGNANLKPLVESVLKEKDDYDFVVLVNAAHGGDNKGNVVNELQEKKITLAVGKELERLSVDGKVGIFLIRQEDADISNESRADVIGKIAPDLVVDLHVNADATNERTQGTSVIYNENFYRPEVTNVQMADIIERNLVLQIQGKALGIFGDSQNKYPLLSMVEVPAVSVEMGYLTNKQEALLLRKGNYQEKIALGIFKGILEIKEMLR